MSMDRITRRGALFMLGAAAVPQARAEGGLLRATRVDHVALAVGDIDKAMMFYRRLFGNEVLKDSRTPRRYLRLGPCYVAIAPAAAGEARRIDHFGIGIEHFDAPGIEERAREGRTGSARVECRTLCHGSRRHERTDLGGPVVETTEQCRTRSRPETGSSLSPSGNAPCCDPGQRHGAGDRILPEAVRRACAR